MRIVLALVLVLAISSALVPSQARAAVFCIPAWDFAECQQPEGGGEPPNWCGSGRIGELIGKIKQEAREFVEAITK
jgi:hypothetical protein